MDSPSNSRPVTPSHGKKNKNPPSPSVAVKSTGRLPIIIPQPGTNQNLEVEGKTAAFVSVSTESPKAQEPLNLNSRQLTIDRHSLSKSISYDGLYANVSVSATASTAVAEFLPANTGNGWKHLSSGNLEVSQEPSLSREQSPSTTSMNGADKPQSTKSSTPSVAGVGSTFIELQAASEKRNQEFHQLFRSVPESDPLIEDYSSALQRDILIHGRLYLTQDHLCFNSNIFGWVTNLVVAFGDVLSIERKSTAFLIPNAIQVTTLHSRYIFTSFMYREMAFMSMVQLWKTKTGLEGDLSDKPNVFEDDHLFEEPIFHDPTQEMDEEDEVSSTGNGSLSDGDLKAPMAPKHDDSKFKTFPRNRASSRELRPASAAADTRPWSATAKPIIQTQLSTVSQAETIKASNGHSKPISIATTAAPTTIIDLQVNKILPPVFCNCNDHPKSQLIDMVVTVPPMILFYLIYGDPEFDLLTKFLTQIKLYQNLVIPPWTPFETGTERSYSYQVPAKANRMIKYLVEQKCSKVVHNECVCIRETISAPEATNGAYYQLHLSQCFMRVGNGETRLFVCYDIVFNKNIWAKASTEKAVADRMIGFWKAFETFLLKYLSDEIQRVDTVRMAAKQFFTIGPSNPASPSAPMSSTHFSQSSLKDLSSAQSWLGFLGENYQSIITVLALLTTVFNLGFLLWLQQPGSQTEQVILGSGGHGHMVPVPEWWLSIETFLDDPILSESDSNRYQDLVETYIENRLGKFEPVEVSKEDKEFFRTGDSMSKLEEKVANAMILIEEKMYKTSAGVDALQSQLKQRQVSEQVSKSVYENVDE